MAVKATAADVAKAKRRRPTANNARVAFVARQRKISSFCGRRDRVGRPEIGDLYGTDTSLPHAR